MKQALLALQDLQVIEDSKENKECSIVPILRPASPTGDRGSELGPELRPSRSLAFLASRRQ